MYWLGCCGPITQAERRVAVYGTPWLFCAKRLATVAQTVVILRRRTF
jgi:hypothetical protein